MKSMKTLTGGLMALGIVGLVVGCGKPAGTGGTGIKPGAGATKPAGKEDHAHGEGPHGGAVGDWGGGKMHIEFIVDHDKKEATVYILASDVKKAAPIKAKDGKIAGSITGVKDKGTFEVILEAMPQEGDPAGTSSRFVGKHDKIGVVQEFEGTITGESEGTPYTGKFKEEPAKDKK